MLRETHPPAMHDVIIEQILSTLTLRPDSRFAKTYSFKGFFEIFPYLDFMPLIILAQMSNVFDTCIRYLNTQIQ